MFKYLPVFILLCCGGCQTIPPESTTPRGALGRDEKLLLRLEKIVGTYEVAVQRAVLTGPDSTKLDQWEIIAAANVSGYPESWRVSADAGDPAAAGAKGTFLTGGDTVSISLDTGTRMTAKVIPETRNTARVVGVFVQVEDGIHYTAPFDVHCIVGEVVILQRADSAVAPAP